MLLYYVQDGGQGGTLRLEHLDWGGPNGEPPDSRSFIKWMEAGHLWPWTLRWNDSLFICVKHLLCVWVAVCCRVNRPPCPGSGETHSHNISRCPCLQPPGVRWKSPCKHGSAFPQCKGHRGGSGVGSHSPPAALLLRGRRVPPTRGLSQHPVTWRGHGLAPRGPRFHR